MRKKIWLTNFIFKEVDVGYTGHCMFCHKEVLTTQEEMDKHIWANCLPESERKKPPRECNKECLLKD